MRKTRTILVLSILSLFAGCTLEKAPECVPGVEKCTIDDLTKRSSFFACNENHELISLQECDRCDGEICIKSGVGTMCDTDGEKTCKNYDGKSVALSCAKGQWMASFCGVGVNCDGDHCTESESRCDNEGENLCVWMENMNLAVHSVCVGHQWHSMFCPGGQKCDGNVCGTEQSTISCVRLGEIRDDATNTCVCDVNNHWTGQAGACTCETGYQKFGDHCEIPVDCVKPHTIRDDETNTCICDIDNHWTGSDGNCTCETDYIEIVNNSGEVCEPITECTNIGEIYEMLTNSCVCDTDNHWTGTAGNCDCEPGFTRVSDKCESNKPAECGDGVIEGEEQCEGNNYNGKTCSDLVQGSTGSLKCNNCVIDTSGCITVDTCGNGQIEEGEQCDGSDLNGKTCSDFVQGSTGTLKCSNCNFDDSECVCGLGEVRNNATNTCVCDTANHWTGTTGKCDCDAGYERINDVCVPVCSNPGEIRDNATNTCVCDTANHWTGTSGSCQCEPGYIPKNGKCELGVTCNNPGEVRDNSTNTCVCDTANHWTGNAGKCDCDSGYERINDGCEPVCPDPGKIEVDGVCVCDTDNHWKIVSDYCECEEGYQDVNNKCVPVDEY